ncbi:F-box protein [Quillaja saponaria]|uniref:F-box protein n=1 Tax=Quillaja saponaria TaxID=32244 RepID=A0AAD7VJX2_QUISA|nr:F-box protein [Quillaja saponaria]
MAMLREDIPEEIAIDILARSPVKSLFRFMSACKSWRSLITDPVFISKHQRHSAERGNSCLLHLPTSFPCGQIDKLCILTSDDDPLVVEDPNVPVPFQTVSQSYYFLGSCNGLLCLTDSGNYFGHTLYLWNPAAKISKTLFSSCITHKFVDKCSCSILGFGFDRRSNDYKIVRIMYQLDGTMDFDPAPPEVEVYSLKSDSWKVFGTIVPRITEKSEAFINDALHWLALEAYGDNPSYRLIVSFNVVDEKFNYMSLPADVIKNDEVPVDDMSLTAFKDSLALFVYYHAHDHADDDDGGWCDRFDVWFMMDHGLNMTWTKQYTVVQETMCRSVGFTRSGKILLEKASIPNKLLLWDPSNQQTESTGVPWVAFFVSVVPFTESLALVETETANTGQTNSMEGVTYRGINILLEEEGEWSSMQPSEECHKGRNFKD